MLEVVKDFRSLEDDWNRLSGKAPNVFMTFDWMRLWGRSIETLVVRRDENIVGIAPLVRSGRKFQR